MARLEVKNLNKKYSGGAQALTAFNLTSNGITAIVGGEKAGKTTLLKCLAGLESFDGSVILNGIDVSNLPTSGRNTFMFFEDYALFERKTVFDNLSYPLKIRGENSDYVNDKVREVLDLFEIRPFLLSRVKLLDNNTKRAVALSRILLREADLYLLDNPLKGLFGEERKFLFNTLKATLKNHKGVVIYATDEPSEALSLTEQIVVLNQGYTKQIGDMTSLYFKPQSLLVGQTFGNLNVAEGALVEVENRLYAEFCGYRFLLKITSDSLIDKDYIGGDVLFGFRPEAVIIADEGIEAEVLDNEAKAGYYTTTLNLNGCNILALSQQKQQNNVKIFINLEDICIFDTSSEASILKE